MEPPACLFPAANVDELAEAEAEMLAPPNAEFVDPPNDEDAAPALAEIWMPVILLPPLLPLPPDVVLIALALPD